ncbi:hypothetical protein [Tsukamurella ocularis]|uniref:hypothetical protein n=1 Tax=Tsukamurella ocularis TaxID=1970234 RepID=UPI002168D197|nr:hypothetical protein [Tsukamurella ocularis]MCS3782396.1 hypothetical protein [Tsukamurella ocularis]MCS3789801.1 hypothetical protein [Tsukamurella ocularis]MCS3853186.1 hypothetical protein [Tsukamurella ocularis]
MSAAEVTRPSSAGEKPRSIVLLSGVLLTALGIIGIVAGVLFSIIAPQLRPVPLVFLGFWLVMVFVGKVFFSGLTRLREAGRSAPAPEQIRAAAAVLAIVAATSFAGAFVGAGSSWATCPGDATCPPGPGPQLTFTPPTQQQTTAPGQQGPQQGGQQDNGIATSPAQGGSNDGGNIQAQTPQFGTPGQQAPTVPGNEPDQPAQGTAPARPTGQQPEVRTTAPGRPTPATTTPRRPRIEADSSTSRTTTRSPAESSAPHRPYTTDNDDDRDEDDDPPMWAYLVNESTALTAGRRLRTGSSTLRPGKAVADTQTAYLRTSTRVIPGRVVDKPVTGTPTTGDGLPNPDPFKYFRDKLTAGQRQAYKNIRPGSKYRDAARERAIAEWKKRIGQPNPWDPNHAPITGNEEIHPDHLVPVRTLAAYPGFEYLPKDIQRQIADMPENTWPVPKDPNTDNVDKPKPLWKNADGSDLDPELMAEAIRRVKIADSAIRKRIVKELLNDRDALLSLLRDMGYSEEEIKKIMDLPPDALQKFLDAVINGERPPVLTTSGTDGSELLPKPSKATPGEHQGEAQGVFDSPPFGPDHKLHASDFFKDGWEPPAAVSQARDKAIDALWTALQNSKGMVTTPELDQAWHDYQAINSVYQGLVQQHWADIGRPGGVAPDVRAICIPANVAKV